MKVSREDRSLPTKDNPGSLPKEGDIYIRSFFKWQDLNTVVREENFRKR